MQMISIKHNLRQTNVLYTSKIFYYILLLVCVCVYALVSKKKQPTTSFLHLNIYFFLYIKKNEESRCKHPLLLLSLLHADASSFVHMNTYYIKCEVKLVNFGHLKMLCSQILMKIRCMQNLTEIHLILVWKMCVFVCFQSKMKFLMFQFLNIRFLLFF